MMMRPNLTGGPCTACAEAIERWGEMKSHRWARTSLRRALAIYITESTWARVWSSTMAPLQIAGSEVRWKRFLSRASLTGTRFGSDPRADVGYSGTR